MNKIILSFSLLFFAQLVFAQDWQPIYLNETLNYHSSAVPDEPFGIFASDLSQYADSSDVRIVLNADTIDECLCGPPCFRLRADFIQSRIIYMDNGIVVFQNPDTFYIHTKANIGDAWVFKNDSEGSDITATITSALLTVVLGQTDSLKIITLSNDEEIHLSKSHGITKWINATDTLSLISIPRRGLGQVFLTKAEVYDFNVGDVFSYVIDDNHFFAGEGSSSEIDNRNRRILRFEVLSITESDSIKEIEFALSGFLKSRYKYHSQPTNVSQSYIADTIVKSFNLSSHEKMYELAKKKYWYEGAYINPNEDYWAGGIYDYFFYGSSEQPYFEKMISVNSGMFNNRKMLSFGMKNVNLEFDSETTILELLDIELNLEMNKDYVSYCEQFEINHFVPDDVVYNLPTSYRDDFKMSAEGIGVVVYYGQFMYSMGMMATFKAIMTGYKKGEETFGYVPEVIDLISVGVSDRPSQVNFSVFPNPTSNVINILMPTSDFGKLRLLDISGRVLYTMPINSEKVKIETTQFPSGVYFIQVETQNGIGVEKVIISR